MDYSTLQIFLPAFMIVFLSVSIWAQLRKKEKAAIVSEGHSSSIKRIRLTDRFFNILLLVSISVGFLYAYFPDYYYLTGPLHFLDRPVINVAGMLILKVSLLWMVIAQFNVERTLALFNSGADQLNYIDLLSHAEKFVLAGILIMFFGLFITLSSILAGIVCVIGVILFGRLPKLHSE